MSPPDASAGGLQFFCDARRHLVCVPYSVENLHRMASVLDLHRCWFHAGDKPHYDMPKRRITELTARCQLVSSRQILAIIIAGQATENDQAGPPFVSV